MEKYTLEDCSMYTHLQIKNKDVYIFEAHNMALPVWGTYSDRYQTEFNLITFDSHTDTRTPFTAEVISRSNDFEVSPKHPVVKDILKGKHYKKDEFCFEDVFKIALQYVRNDEHILTADYFGYIKSYNVICDLDDFEAKGYESDDRVRGYDAKYFVREQQSKINYNDIELPIILDFDLDYFIHDNCINEELKKAIAPLVKNATLITIAKEPEYFEQCKMQNDYTNKKALEDLLLMIEQVL
ncbi:MAG: hypothetical protein E7286_08340 [Lachnospiraceae bacterium]|nr:hypothetical protein [Lachnospiraceae bacterium]